MRVVKVDVVVAGGGPAGVAAAVASAQNGAKTLLIEQCGFLGGMLTNGSLPTFCPFSDGEKAIVRGIGLEILNDMRKEAWENPEPEENNGIPELDWVPVDAEILKRVMDDRVASSGAEVWLHTTLTAVEKQGDALTAVTVSNKEGQTRMEADVFIDCTGDADLVAQAGGEFEYGDEAGLVQGATLCFRISGIDGHKFLEYKRQTGENGNLTVAVRRARENHDFPFPEKFVATFVLQNWGMASVNFGHVFGMNPLKVKDLTDAEMESRKMLPAMLSFLQKYVPGAEHAVLASSGPLIGIRESRRITGEYRLTRQDYLERNHFFDDIGRYAYPLDVHASTAQGIVTEDAKDDFVNLRYQPGESYGIPYRALLPKSLENVIVAGRSVSSARAIYGSVRVTPACVVMGQAAGTAAAIACATKTNPKTIDIKRLQNLLVHQGALI